MRQSGAWAVLVGLLLGLAGCGSTATKECSSATCSGCCAVDGTCQPGDQDNACGRIGGSCGACSVIERCVFGLCVNRNEGTGGGTATGGGGGAMTGGGTGGGAMTGGGTGGGSTSVGQQLWVRGALDGGTVAAVYRQASPASPVVQVSAFPRRGNGFAVSNDGTFAVLGYDATTDELMVLSRDGGADLSLRVSGSSISMLEPVLSPDKSQLAWMEGNSSTGGPGFDLFVMPTNASATARKASPTRATATTINNVVTYAFSPDSRYVASMGDYSVDGAYELHVFDLQSGAFTSIVSPLNATAGQSSRDFGWTSTGQLLVRAALGGATTRLHLCTVTGSCAPLAGTTVSATVGNLAVSKDGTFAVYSSNERGVGAYELYKVPAAGGTPVRITPDGLPSSWRPQVDSVVLSPDGLWVSAQTGAGLTTDGGVNVGLYVFSTNGGSGGTPLYVASGTVAVFDPAFDVDSSALFFRADIHLNGSYDLFKLPSLTAPGTPLTVLFTNGGDITQFLWTR